MGVYLVFYVIMASAIHMWVKPLRGAYLSEPGDEVVAVLVLLQTSKCHLSAWDVLLGVLEVIEQGLRVPCNTLFDVSLGV